jgi:hypothetical protein
MIAWTASSLRIRKNLLSHLALEFFPPDLWLKTSKIKEGKVWGVRTYKQNKNKNNNKRINIRGVKV